ncbi:hypothetical protein H632_c1111p0, partial [Helicosporidium sp. ATCC 50920]
MAEQALKARDFATASVQQQLHDATDMLLEAKAEKSVIEQQEAAAQEETQQLATMLQDLLSEKAELTSAVTSLRLEKQYLAEENELLRQQLL